MIDCLPAFICECCTVRAVLGRELTLRPHDLALMMLERMRLIDTIHNLAPSSFRTYKSKITQIHRFESLFELPVLRRPKLTRPPISESIPLMWAQQHYALQDSRNKKDSDKKSKVTYSTTRGLRSAASHYHTWLLHIEHPAHLINDQRQRPVVVERCRPTDELGYVMMAAGMSRRLGEDSTPAKALLDRHIRWINNHLEGCYRRLSVTTGPLARTICRAALCNLVAWLAWLRSMETFSLRWSDIGVILPADGRAHDLPTNVGALLLKLLPQTKSSPTRTADVPIAFATGSGLNPGIWLLRLRDALDEDANTPSSLWATDDRYLFAHENGKQWTSNFFRTTYLFPFLHAQRLAGDAYLLPFDGSEGNTLERAFWSWHIYRNGARTEASLINTLCSRCARVEEIFEHGRWRVSRDSMTMPQRYLQLPLTARLAITLLCM
jgi:hypothetical protein